MGRLWSGLDLYLHEYCQMQGTQIRNVMRLARNIAELAQQQQIYAVHI